MPSCSSKACATPKAPGRGSHLSLSTGRSRSSGIFSGCSSPTATGSSILPILRFRRNRESRSLPLRWHSCSPAVTERNAPRFTAVLPTVSRHPLCSTWRLTWCGCVRHFQNESRYWIPRNGSFISQRAVSTRCSRRM